MKATFCTALTIPLFALSLCAEAQDRSCAASDFQACKTCDQLESAVDLEQPNLGDYYRGAQWNGLFAAYRPNCPIIGVALIAAGTNPASGGLFGSMIISVSGNWPHDDKKVNEAWAAMLLLTGAVTDTRIGERQNKTTSDLLSESGITLENPDIYELFDR